MLQINNTHPRLQTVLAFVLIALLLILALFPGMRGALYYDDLPTLEMARKVLAGEESLMDFFAFGFNVGALGRPISLLSFLQPWQSTEGLLAVNIALHIVNTMLVGLLGWRIGKMLQFEQAIWLGILTAALWGLAPIQAGTVLITVQRMAELAALFIWLGLLLWIIGLQRSMSKPVQGYFLQFIGLFGMGALAVLSKENGALLPLLAGVIEFTLLAHLSLPGRSKRQLLYIGTAILLFAYLIYNAWASDGTFLERNFNVFERILTESIILFDYLRQTIFPSINAIHPFHDNYPVIRSIQAQPLALVALVFWPATALIAWILRKCWPFLSMAILWFLTAHLLESTTLGLELYFLHRQYIPWFGVALAISWLVLNLPISYRKLGITILVIYILFLGFMLRQTAQVWGNPTFAAQVWFKENIRSPRATEHLVSFYLQANHLEKAFEIHKSHVDACPDCLGSITLLAKLSCLLDKYQDTQQLLKNFFETAPKTLSVGYSPEILTLIELSVADSSCKLISMEDLIHMNEALLNRKIPMYEFHKQILVLNLFRIMNDTGRFNEAAHYLMEAYPLSPTPYLSLVVIRYLLEMKLISKAKDFTNQSICSHQEDDIMNPHAWAKACAEANVLIKQQTSQ